MKALMTVVLMSVLYSTSYAQGLTKNLRKIVAKSCGIELSKIDKGSYVTQNWESIRLNLSAAIWDAREFAREKNELGHKSLYCEYYNYPLVLVKYEKTKSSRAGTAIVIFGHENYVEDELSKELKKNYY